MDGLQVAGYAAAVQAAVAGVVWIGKKLTTVKVTEAEAEAKMDEWLRSKLDEAMKGREIERGECTSKIETLRGRLDVAEQKQIETDKRLDDTSNRLRECHDGRAQDIAGRHAIARQLRELGKKYDDIRSIVDVIQELPPESRPPPPTTILRKQQP